MELCAPLLCPSMGWRSRVSATLASPCSAGQRQRGRLTREGVYISLGHQALLLLQLLALLLTLSLRLLLLLLRILLR